MAYAISSDPLQPTTQAPIKIMNLVNGSRAEICQTKESVSSYPIIDDDSDPSHSHFVSM